MVHEPLRDNRFTKFPMRFPNKCLTCSTKLPEKSMAYGTKIDGKWKFLCEKCHNDLLAGFDDDEPKVPEDFEDGGVEVEDLDPEFMEKLNLVADDEVSDGTVTGPVLTNQPKKRKSVLKLIKENAQWRI